MKTNTSKSKALRLCALILTSGALLSTTGCNKSIDSLFFTVKGNQLEVTFCDRGASIYSIKYNGNLMTYHPKDKNVFIDNNYYGKCLGRIAGRIPDGNLRVGDKEYNLEVNETSSKGKNNCLHGGKSGLYTKDWTHEVVEKSDHYEVTFKYLSSAGESGFPEALNVRYVYKVSKTDGRLDIAIDAGSSGVTPVDLSIHPYFRLGGDNILDHTLKINANLMGEYDTEGHQTVIGEKPVASTPWDFNGGKKIGDDIEEAKTQDEVSGGYDHIWYFGEDEFNFELSYGNTKLTVDSIDSNAVIMYANCYPVKDQIMSDDKKDTKYAAITIEPYTFFTTEQQSIEKLFIDKDKSFSRHITYTFSNN